MPKASAKHRGCQCCAGSERVFEERLPPRLTVFADLVTPGPLGSTSLPQPSQRNVAPKRIGE